MPLKSTTSIIFSRLVSFCSYTLIRGGGTKIFLVRSAACTLHIAHILRIAEEWLFRNICQQVASSLCQIADLAVLSAENRWRTRLGKCPPFAHKHARMRQSEGGARRASSLELTCQNAPSEDFGDQDSNAEKGTREFPFSVRENPDYGTAVELIAPPIAMQRYRVRLTKWPPVCIKICEAEFGERMGLRY